MFETHLNLKLCLFFVICFCLMTACQPAAPACPAGSISYLQPGTNSQVFSPLAITRQLVEIKGQELLVDQIVRGKLCNQIWSGTIYVSCQIGIYAWEENPDFLADCDLNIAPGTVVYVAAHNNEPYYQGCSCHTGEDSQ